MQFLTWHFHIRILQSWMRVLRVVLITLTQRTMSVRTQRIRSGEQFTRNVAKSLVLQHILTIHGSGRTRTDSRKRDLLQYLEVDLTQVLLLSFRHMLLSIILMKFIRLIYLTVMVETTDIHLLQTLTRKSTFVKYQQMAHTG